MSNLASFWKIEAYGQTVLPDRSVLIKQKLVENTKINKFKCDIKIARNLLNARKMLVFLCCFLTNFPSMIADDNLENWEEEKMHLVLQKKSRYVMSCFCISLVVLVVLFFVYVVIPSCFSTLSKAHDVWWQYFMYSHVHCVCICSCS